MDGLRRPVGGTVVEIAMGRAANNDLARLKALLEDGS
jgi:hypothetical protein